MTEPLSPEVERERRRAEQWLVLSRQRWGPAVGDPEPGITIARPDPLKVRLAMQGHNKRPDREFCAERQAIRALDSEPVRQLDPSGGLAPCAFCCCVHWFGLDATGVSIELPSCRKS